MKKEDFKEAAISLANNQADELEVKGALSMNREEYIEAESAKILDSLMKESGKQIAQMETAGAILQEKMKQLPEVERVKVQKEFTEATKKLEEYDGGVSLDEEPLQDHLGLTDPTLLWIYQVGHKSFTSNQYEESKSLFSLLAMLNPLVCDYWMGLGFALEALELYKESIHAFSMASFLKPKYFLSRYKSATVYLQLEMFDDALAELEVLEEIIGEQKLDSYRPQLEELKNKAKNKEKP